MSFGLIELFKSRKATMSLIILACATTALFLSKLDGTSYAAVIGTIAVIYNYTQNKSDLAYQANQNNVQVINNIPERGTP